MKRKKVSIFNNVVKIINNYDIFSEIRILKLKQENK